MTPPSRKKRLTGWRMKPRIYPAIWIQLPLKKSTNCLTSFQIEKLIPGPTRSLETALKREATDKATPWRVKMKSLINRTYGDCLNAGMGVDRWLASDSSPLPGFRRQPVKPNAPSPAASKGSAADSGT